MDMVFGNENNYLCGKILKMLLHVLHFFSACFNFFLRALQLERMVREMKARREILTNPLPRIKTILVREYFHCT